MSEGVLEADASLLALMEAEALVPGIGWAALALTIVAVGGYEIYEAQQSAEREHSESKPGDVVTICDDKPSPQDKCKEKRADILSQYAKLGTELRKYDPAADAIGGFPMRGGALTTPCGHYKKITDFQRGLRRRLREFNKTCAGSGVRIDKNVDRMANATIETPPGCPEINVNLD